MIRFDQQEAIGFPLVEFRGAARLEGVMKERCPIALQAFMLAGALALGGASVHAAEETVQGMLAAQIRAQGFACGKALGATKDAKRSRPDHAVWVLKCSNATYRVSRAPDIAAKVEPLR